MNNDEVLQDFRRRWEQSYVWLKMKKTATETLAYIRRVEADQSKIGVIHLESADFGSMTINLGSADHSLLFRYPQSGVFQCGVQAAYYRRRPIRQWRRGVCSDNSHLLPTSRNVTVSGLRMELSTVKAAFDHKTYSVVEAMEFLTTKRAKSVALADNLSVMLSPTPAPEHVVLFWDQAVARCDAKGNLTHVYEKVMEVQLKGVFNNG